MFLQLEIGNLRQRREMVGDGRRAKRTYGLTMTGSFKEYLQEW